VIVALHVASTWDSGENWKLPCLPQQWSARLRFCFLCAPSLSVNARTMSASSSPKCVPELWFPDASLVFQAENSLFRVYSGILAQQSSVFRDILSLPQAEPSKSESDTVDGCPRIVLHDRAVDVTSFFRAIYDSRCVTMSSLCFQLNFCIFSFFVPPFAPPLETLGGILRLSIKYDVDYLRQRCLAPIGHLPNHPSRRGSPRLFTRYHQLPHAAQSVPRLPSPRAAQRSRGTVADPLPSCI
jgi:hypothetical protein